MISRAHFERIACDYGPGLTDSLWLPQERELLSSQVEDIRGRLLEAKLQNVKLKNELTSRNEQAATGCCASARGCCRRRRERKAVRVFNSLWTISLCFSAFFWGFAIK